MGKKTEGIQAHHVIQSFKPGEVTPELANQIGQDLARRLPKGMRQSCIPILTKNTFIITL
ncbi:hypothetical protein GCM10020331_012920 [Ectobacillus funiculus]